MPHSPKPSPLTNGGRALMAWVDYHHRQDVKAGGSAGSGVGSGAGPGKPPKPADLAGAGFWWYDGTKWNWTGLGTDPGGGGGGGRVLVEILAEEIPEEDSEEEVAVWLEERLLKN